MLRQIEPAVQRGHEWRGLPVEQRPRIVVEMEVEEVELVVITFLPHALEHHHVERVGIAYRAIEPQGFRPCCVKLGRRLGIAARKQCDVMSERDQLFRQPMHHPLGAAIKLGWNSLRQRSYLRDAHLTISLVRDHVKDIAPLRPAPAHARYATLPQMRSSMP